MFKVRKIDDKIECVGDYPEHDEYDFIAGIEESEFYPQLTKEWMELEYYSETESCHYDSDCGWDRHNIYYFNAP